MIDLTDADGPGPATEDRSDAPAPPAEPAVPLPTWQGPPPTTRTRRAPTSAADLGRSTFPRATGLPRLDGSAEPVPPQAAPAGPVPGGRTDSGIQPLPLRPASPAPTGRRRHERRERERLAAEQPVPATGGPRRVNRSRVALEWMVVVAAALFVALLLQLTTFQVFAIPSESMTPTLAVGDRVVVNKWAYRFSDVHVGDVVVFTEPRNFDTGAEDLVKRVVAIGGQTVTITDDELHVDGYPIDEPYLAPDTLTQPTGTHSCAVTSPCVVPEGQLWVMGDNRGNSIDSRYFGPIPESTVVGEVELRIWPPSRAGGL